MTTAGGGGGNSAGPRTLTNPQGCSRREETSEGAPEAVRQAVGGGCQSAWGRLLSVTNAIEAGTCRQGGQWLGMGWAPWRGGGGVPPPPRLPMHPRNPPPPQKKAPPGPPQVAFGQQVVGWGGSAHLSLRGPPPPP